MTDHSKIEALVRDAGKMMLEAHLSEGSIHAKPGDANFCTEYDTKIQQFLIAKLSALMPEAGFFGEEDTAGNQDALADKEFIFYIDPIDGTTNFMFGYHHSCVSVALAQKGEPIAAFVYNPYADEMFTAFRGQGSFLNGRKLCLADLPLEKGIAAFGCARYNEGGIDKLFDCVKEMFHRSLAIRSGGSAALEMCRVASGSDCIYLELKLQPYDYAAAMLIVTEAGGIVTQTDGSPATLERPCSMLCGTPAAHRQVMELWKTIA